MRGLLFYDNDGAVRNKWFIQRLIDVAKERGCDLKLVISDDEIERELKISPDFAMVRTINPHLNERLESLNVPTFNNSKTSRIANDKWLSYLYAKGLGISVMKTEKISTDSLPDIPYPFVIKTVDGHGGSEVFMVDNQEKCKYILANFSDRSLIAQESCSEAGIDMRVYTLGGSIVASVKRTSSTDFRSNFSLGGHAELSEPEDTIKEAVAKIYAALGCDFVGIDFIRHNGRWVLNEIEDVVGTRMLYSLTDIDAAEMYVDHIIKILNSRK